MGYCPLSIRQLGAGLGARGKTAAARGARATRARGARDMGAGRAAGRAVGPAGSALGALSLFLARFDSVFFRSQIFGHCS